MNNKFNVGEKVRVKPGFTSYSSDPNYGGGGYVYRDNLILEIIGVTEGFIGGSIYNAYFFKDWHNGMYEFVLEGIDVVREEKINKILYEV